MMRPVVDLDFAWSDSLRKTLCRIWPVVTLPLLAGLDYQNDTSLDPALIGRRWPRSLPVSASRLESFGRCPYQFFSRYLLELQKREILRLEPLDLGKLYHRVLERLFYDLRKDKLDIASASDETLAEPDDGVV